MRHKGRALQSLDPSQFDVSFAYVRGGLRTSQFKNTVSRLSFTLPMGHPF